MERRTYTVESVTSGHPDKICDQVSDAILDACLRQDSESRVAIECFGSHGLFVIGGEVTTDAAPDYEGIARNLYRAIGYEDDLRMITEVVRQSPDIAQGVEKGGAGDQGIMYGYASNETAEYLPRGIVLVHGLTRGLERLRRGDPDFGWLKPDGKTQITMENGRIVSVLVSCQHGESIPLEDIRRLLIEKLIRPLLGDISSTEVFVNPTGKFVIGGFEADTGLTGRKIMVDTYGGYVAHGGGAFSGKDPTKVDRSAAYMARFAAKNIVANGIANNCLVSVAYAIGKAEPLMLHAISDKGEDLGNFLWQKFDFRPHAIIERLGLRRPIYAATACYGHFGREGMPWEEIISL
jgi:S-adenosylmethionine synthetase